MRKSRCALSLNNRGEFSLVDASMNVLVLGWDYTATLDEIEHWLRDEPEPADSEAFPNG